MAIEIIKKKITKGKLKEIAQETFDEMVKAVVDIDQEILAIGGELHADGEAVLLENGSEPGDLWGVNIYLNKPRDKRIEFSALINIRPSVGNRSIKVQDLKIQQKIREIIDKLIE